MNRTTEYWQCVVARAQAAGVPEVGSAASLCALRTCLCPGSYPLHSIIIEIQTTANVQARIKKLQSAQILRSLATRTAYTNAAVDVVCCRACRR